MSSIKKKRLIKDKRFVYEKHIAVKAIIERTDGKVLLIREPENNEWMPLHWGLPGGKPFAKESLEESFKRKMKDEIGQKVAIAGLYRIQEMLIEGVSVYFLIVVSKVGEGFETTLADEEFRWVDLEDVEKMEIIEFSEFFNKEMLTQYLKGEKDLVPFSIVETRKYYEMANNDEYAKWLQSGKND